MYWAEPALADLGGKTGCRRLFARATCRTRWAPRTWAASSEVSGALSRCGDPARPSGQVIVKTNGAYPGGQRPGRPGGTLSCRRAAARAMGERVRAISWGQRQGPLDAYVASFAQDGGIVEERISGAELLSPSVQLRAIPTAAWSCCPPTTSCSGGPADRATSVACSPPTGVLAADQRTGSADRRAARRRRRGGQVRHRLRGRQGTKGSWAAFAIEVNLRKGGTARPFLALQLLTDGRYDGAGGPFRSGGGREKELVATDHLERTDCGPSPWTACSTRSLGTACTSTRPGRPASCST